MSIALYRKYRPKTFGEVTNQNHIKITLQNEISTNHLAHAYLFCGPRGTGKTTMARLLAKAVNCLDLQENGEPCNSCRSCQEIMENKSLDIIEIDAASHTGVDNVRDNIINNARFSPAKEKFKVFIIDEVHMLSTQAFNALLKTLEEPPAHVIFILATTEIQKVPVTIISRCQRFDFRKIILPELVDRLRMISKAEGVTVEESILVRIAQSAGGCVRDGESLLEQVLSLGGTSISADQAELIIPRSNYGDYLKLLEFLMAKDTRSAIELINVLVEGGTDLQHYFNKFIDFIRRVMIYRITQSMEELLQDMDQEMVQQIIKKTIDVPPSYFSRVIEVFLLAREQFKQNYILQLPFEVAIVELTKSIPYPEKQTKEELPTVIPSANIPVNNTPPTEASNLNNSPQASENIPTVVDSPPEEPSVIEEKKTLIEEKPAEKSEIPVNPVIKSNNGMSLTFNQVLTRWPLVIKAISEKNYSLGMALSVARPLTLSGNSLLIGFKFELQRTRFSHPTNINQISLIFEQEFGVPLKLEAVVDDTLKLSDFVRAEAPETVNVEQDEVKDPLTQVIDAFGGAVVDKI